MFTAVILILLATSASAASTNYVDEESSVVEADRIIPGLIPKPIQVIGEIRSCVS